MYAVLLFFYLNYIDHFIISGSSSRRNGEQPTQPKMDSGCRGKVYARTRRNQLSSRID